MLIKLLKIFGITVGLMLAAFICILAYLFIVGTSQIDELKDPKSVQQVTGEYIKIGEEKIVKLPGITKIPAESAVFKKALARGIEISANGRVYGLLKIWHWCGHDSVRRHIARVDLSVLAGMLAPDQIQVKSDKHKLQLVNYAHSLGDVDKYEKYGWNVRNYRYYLEFSALFQQK